MGSRLWCDAFRHPERRKTSYVKKWLIWKYENWVEGSKRRRILMTLRVVVISSVAERSLLQYVNQHVCAISSTTFLFCVFLLSRTDFLPVCKKDRGLRSGWRYMRSGTNLKTNSQSLLSNFRLPGSRLWRGAFRHPRGEKRCMLENG